MTRTSRVLLCLALAGVTGLIAFGIMAWQSVTVSRVDVDEALQRFLEVRAQFGGSEPILRMQADGRVVRTKEPTDGGTSPSYFRLLAYRAAEHRLVRANIPFWFLKAKGPALNYTFRDTGLDLKRLGISPSDLGRYGPCLVFDETSADGGRLLVWTD